MSSAEGILQRRLSHLLRAGWVTDWRGLFPLPADETLLAPHRAEREEALRRLRAED